MGRQISKKEFHLAIDKIKSARIATMKREYVAHCKIKYSAPGTMSEAELQLLQKKVVIAIDNALRKLDTRITNQVCSFEES